jgi:hypothetical protein
MKDKKEGLVEDIYSALFYKDYTSLIRYIDKLKDTDFEIYKDILTIIGNIDYMHLKLENLVEKLVEKNYEEV